MQFGKIGKEQPKPFSKIILTAQAIVEKYSRKLEARLSEKNTRSKRIQSAVDFIVDELIFDSALNRVFYNLIQMAFERLELRDVMKQMFLEYRNRLARFFAEIGAVSPDDAMGSAIVALAEGFSLQIMVQPDAISRSEVQRLILETVQQRLQATSRRKTHA